MNIKEYRNFKMLKIRELTRKQEERFTELFNKLVHLDEHWEEYSKPWLEGDWFDFLEGESLEDLLNKYVEFTKKDISLVRDLKNRRPNANNSEVFNVLLKHKLQEEERL